VDSREVIRLLTRAGWALHSQKGSHRHYRHPARPGKVTVPHPRKDIPPKTLKSIFKQAGIEEPRRRGD
jgi:predicted RNA binding protein YcfA (HicA-like mRNA interferase family)